MTEFFVVLFAILCVDVTYRICTASARDWKHSKSYCRQCRAETPRWRKLLGLYPDGDCKAPYHLRKYQRLRRLNSVCQDLRLKMIPRAMESVAAAMT